MKFIDCYNFYLGGDNSFRNLIIIEHLLSKNKYHFYYSTGTSNKNFNFPNCWFPSKHWEPYGSFYSKNIYNNNFLATDNKFGILHKKCGLINKIYNVKNKDKIIDIFNIDLIKDEKSDNINEEITQIIEKSYNKIQNCKEILFNLKQKFEDINYKKLIKLMENKKKNNVIKIRKKDREIYKKYKKCYVNAIKTYQKYSNIFLYHFINKFENWEELQISAFLSLDDDENLWNKSKVLSEIRDNVINNYLTLNKEIIYNLEIEIENNLDKYVDFFPKNISGLNYKEKKIILNNIIIDKYEKLLDISNNIIPINNIIVRDIEDLMNNNSICKKNYKGIEKRVRPNEKIYDERFLIINKWLFDNDVYKIKQNFSSFYSYLDLKDIVKKKLNNEELNIFKEINDENVKSYIMKQKEDDYVLQLDKPYYKIHGLTINIPLINQNSLKEIGRVNEIINYINDIDKSNLKSLPLSSLPHIKKIRLNRLEEFTNYVEENY